jgi:hypothetical protein
MLGPHASKTQVENRRRLINKWLAGKSAPSDRNAERLARIYGKPPAYFKTIRTYARRERETLSRFEARLSELSQDVVELGRELRRETAFLRAELAALRRDIDGRDEQPPRSASA